MKSLNANQGPMNKRCPTLGCLSVLWIPGQTKQASFTVGGYGIETVLALKPLLRDFRFVFFDYAGKKNAAAKATSLVRPRRVSLD